MLASLSAHAQGPAPSARCGALLTMDFSRVPDAPTQILAATHYEATDVTPAHCEVHGYVAPQVGFGLRLPSDTWNGKMLMIGCGGLCGGYDWPLDACGASLGRGYACVATDMGHKSSVFDGKWAYENLQGEVDFAFRATHVTLLTGREIVNGYYRELPRRAYFMGCSQGGRQALKSAQNFPADFDGIIAGAPLVGGVAGLLWPALSVTAEDGTSLLDGRAVQLVHDAVLDRCDMDDNVRDGVVSDPLRCKFEPAERRCTGDGHVGCLTDAQVGAVARIYGGLAASEGQSIYSDGLERGSELNWARDVVGRFINPHAGVPEFLLTDIYRYLAFTPDTGPSWQLADFDFKRDPARIDMFEALHGVRNPDLRRFKAAGGKLLIYHGWNDTSIPPRPTVDYYEAVVRTMGGRAATEDFARLFMVPGLNHCTGGDGAYAVDYLRYLEAWVERSRPPDVLIGVHPVEEQPYKLLFHDMELTRDPGSVEFSRPVYPYPRRARYVGRGDPARADNFEAVEP